MGRQAVLTHLKTIIEASLVGFTPTITVYDFVPSRLNVSPAITIFAAGSGLLQGRQPIVTHTVYVRLSATYKSEAQSDERDAQVAVSDLSDILMSVIANNRQTEHWSDLNIQVKTDVAPIKLMGAPFFSELYTVLVTVL